MIIRPGAIGDCILCLPAMEFLKAGYTEVWVPHAVVPLIRFADRVRAISSTGIDLFGLPGLEPPGHLIEKLSGFDSIVSWYGSAREDFRRAALEMSLPIQFLPALPGAGCPLHCADFFAVGAGAAVPAVPRIDAGTAKRIEPPYAVIHPFSGSPRKNWPLLRYRELARQLPMHTLWSAGPGEELQEAVRFENLYDLAGWLRGAIIYIGNDSGITHLAAACGARVVAIFGPTDPAMWAPRGAQVQLVVEPNLEELSVDRVLRSIGPVL